MNSTRLVDLYLEACDVCRIPAPNQHSDTWVGSITHRRQFRLLPTQKSPPAHTRRRAGYEATREAWEPYQRRRRPDGRAPARRNCWSCARWDRRTRLPARRVTACCTLTEWTELIKRQRSPAWAASYTPRKKPESVCSKPRMEETAFRLLRQGFCLRERVRAKWRVPSARLRS